MKALVALLASVACAGCAHTSSPFIQNHITIVPPVTWAHDGQYAIDLINDGGTKHIKLTDATGKEFDVYIDHRIGTSTPGAIYLFDLPGKPNSVRVKDEHDFDQKVSIPRIMRSNHALEPTPDRRDNLISMTSSPYSVALLAFVRRGSACSR